MRDRIKYLLLKIKENKVIVNNTYWIIGQRIYIMILSVVITALVARYFGAEQFGLFNYLLSIVTIFTSISTLGLPVMTVQSIVEKHFKEDDIVTSSIILRIISSFVLIGLSLITLMILGTSNNHSFILLLIISSSMIFKSFEVIDYWYQAYHLSKIPSIIKVLTFTLISLMKVIMIVFESSLLTYVFIYLFDSIITGLALLISYARISGNKFRFNLNLKYSKYILSNSWYLIISGLMISIYMHVDKIMLGVLEQSKIHVGYYTAATQIAQMWFFVPLAIITSMQPSIFQAKKTSEISFNKKIIFLYRIIFLMGIAFGVFIIIFSPIIINLLYGRDFEPAIRILTITVWGGIFAILGSARSVWLIANKMQKYTIAFMSFGAVINIILNLLFIPTLQGIGAAYATLISQFSVLIIAPLFWKKTRTSTIIILQSLLIKK